METAEYIISIYLEVGMPTNAAIAELRGLHRQPSFSNAGHIVHKITGGVDILVASSKDLQSLPDAIERSTLVVEGIRDEFPGVGAFVIGIFVPDDMRVAVFDLSGSVIKRLANIDFSVEVAFYILDRQSAPSDADLV